MFEVSSDIYFVVYNLYYVGQNDDLGTYAGPRNWDTEGVTCILMQYQLDILVT
jgi:hypothetical protein